jgi:tetratricopeptide (TPR) repeat protein
VAALRADIDHYRRGEVISARPVSPVDLLKKVVLRNKLVSAVIGVSVLVIFCGALVSIYFLNARLKDANDQYLLAEQRLQAAHQKEREAKLAAEAARSQQARAENALAEMQRAEVAQRKAEERSRQALAETQPEQESRAENDPPVETGAEEPQPKIAERQTPQDASEVDTEAPRPSPSPIPAIAPEAEQAIREASTIYNFELSAEELQSLERTPEKVVRRLTEAMDNVSRALAVQPDLIDAWMLKGRLHWALMEFDRAADSFRQALIVQAEDRLLSTADMPAETLELASGIANAGPDKYLRAAEAFHASSIRQNAIAGRILEFLNRKPNLRKTPGNFPGPLRNKLTENEVALELIRRNGTDARAFVQTNSLGHADVIIWNTEEVADLSPLREIDVSGLAVIGARTIDWPTIFSLPLHSLDFSKCLIERLPQAPRGFLRVRSMKLGSSEVANAGFVRGMPLLERLDLSFTHVTDLAPLGACRQLRHLDISGLNPANLRTLIRLPLESLTLSPMLITDRNSLDTLRFHRTLKVMRSPEDPPNQPASEFWEKLETGKYNQVH